MRLLRHRRGNPDPEYVEAYPTAPPLDSTRASVPFSCSKIDLCFQITGTDIPADRAYALLAAISRIVPAVHGDEEIGVHPISGRLIGNRRLALTDHSRLTIRAEVDRVAEMLPLVGQSLDLDGVQIRVGVPQTRSLAPAARLYSRLVACQTAIRGWVSFETVRR
jgi:CRISPR-associated protein Cas6